MSDNKSNRLAIVTGGASGIGLGAVKRFLREGYEVLSLDANKEAGENSINDLKTDTCVLTVSYSHLTLPTIYSV